MNRRHFLATAVSAGAAALAAPMASCAPKRLKGSRMRLGLVTYQWGRDWDLPTLIANCEKTGLLGVELRVDHKHGVSPALSAAQRAEVKRRFADSPVTCVGLGTNHHFDSPDPDALKAEIERTKAWLRLSRDIGASGVKVKPNNFHKGVPHEKTIEQIGRSLRELARYGAELGQQLRLEVHGTCCHLPVIRAIMEVADHPNARVCWNSNPQDLEDEGLEYNFWLVRDCLGDTAHVREFNVESYPYDRLMELFVNADYSGWILLEARTNPPDRVRAMIEQRRLWKELVQRAQAALG
ncbi:MAG: sugar phosphate isomerase/epimerase [Verrucomicrobia bacterium]|nr:sugar phosphate isomerase/epimerase [Verrucomicrobiota bacterium]